MTSNTSTASRQAFVLTGQAPALPTTESRHAHTDASGFCSICGSVWPCAKARTADVIVRIPVAR